jgi:hypothetical protein
MNDWEKILDMTESMDDFINSIIDNIRDEAIYGNRDLAHRRLHTLISSETFRIMGEIQKFKVSWLAMWLCDMTDMPAELMEPLPSYIRVIVRKFGMPDSIATLPLFKGYCDTLAEAIQQRRSEQNILLEESGFTRVLGNWTHPERPNQPHLNQNGEHSELCWCIEYVFPDDVIIERMRAKGYAC